jgi:hypothetical protein
MFSLEALFWTVFFVVLLPALAVGGALLVRRKIGVETLASHNDVAGFIYAVVGVVYAVLIGFTAIIVWEQFQGAQEVGEREANKLADLYRNAKVFPPQVRDEIHTRLRAYGHAVVEKEWPAMADHKASPEAWSAFDQLWESYYSFQPQGDHQVAWYTESIARMNELGDFRRRRLLSAESGIPPVMWFVLLGAGAIVIGFAFLFGTRNTWAHVLMIAGLALTIGVVLLSIVALEHPYSGITRVRPEAFEQTLRILGK